ncbi:protein FAM135 [Shewanella surugensis]|uniref:Protein FAM135 n=1 Tax=Shewanella surugensis TaxID=212020 RepID=A0ABT0LGL0_9GAMM|nr:protein FAM135 [Shewanella surugensis]MCL1126828.1 protein FAM135 [Shewanella surugensis]
MEDIKHTLEQLSHHSNDSNNDKYLFKQLDSVAQRNYQLMKELNLIKRHIPILFIVVSQNTTDTSVHGFYVNPTEKPTVEHYNPKAKDKNNPHDWGKCNVSTKMLIIPKSNWVLGTEIESPPTNFSLVSHLDTPNES